MKICTTIEQSKKLIELGFDVDSADMHYNVDRYNNESEIFAIPYSELCFYKDSDAQYSVAAWSLSALLELIPPYLGDYKDGIDFGLGRSMNGKWYSAHYLQTCPNGDIKSVKTVTGESAVDAAFEMVCWLKENGKI